MTTINNELIRLADEKGYKVLPDGRVRGASGKILKLRVKKTHGCTKLGYYRFGIKNRENKKRNIEVHRLAGFQKFGEDALKEGIQVRHLDSDSFNNATDNIGIGTGSENMMDRPAEDRLNHAIKASNYIRKVSDEVIAEIKKKRLAGATYKQLMTEYNIKSKSTMHNFIHNDYVTTK